MVSERYEILFLRSANIRINMRVCVLFADACLLDDREEEANKRAIDLDIYGVVLEEDIY